MAWARNAIVSRNTVYVEDFTGSATAKIQAAIDFAAGANGKKIVMLDEKDYYISSTITVKVGVKLLGGHGSSITIGGDFNGLVVERGASVGDLKINVDFTGYTKNAIYLDGVQKFYNSLNRARLFNLIIYNWTGTVSGTAIHCYSGGIDNEISFVDFDTIKISSFAKGLHLKAVQPASSNAWVNANRFTNITLDSCIDFIVLEGSETIPNECSGNIFSNLQIQPSSATNTILQLQGQYNKIDGIVWDLQLVAHSNPVVILKAESDYNEVVMRSVPATRNSNLGKTNNRIYTY